VLVRPIANNASRLLLFLEDSGYGAQEIRLQSDIVIDQRDKLTRSLLYAGISLNRRASRVPEIVEAKRERVDNRRHYLLGLGLICRRAIYQDDFKREEGLPAQVLKQLSHLYGSAQRRRDY
jgi:hypothetical protein